MTPILHDATVKIGKQTYNIRTTLDDENLLRVMNLITDVVERLDETLDQEKTLLLLCLQLGWTLEKMRSKIDEYAEELKEQ